MNWDYILNQPAFVIHSSVLSPERRNFFTENITNANYKNIQVFESVNGYNENELKKEIDKFNIKFDTFTRIGEKGCTLSHMKIYEHIIKNNIQICTIFEDDVYFHSDWDRLAPKFYENTPKDFDVIFIGNQVEECFNENNISRINKLPCYCAHAYIITLKGAKKLLELLLRWDYHKQGYDGLVTIDIMIKNIQLRIRDKKLNSNIFKWYCWNGTRNNCLNKKINSLILRNTGLVYQTDEFETLLKNIYSL